MLFLLLTCVQGQPFSFQSAPSMKHSFCELEALRRNGSLALTQSLAGQRISVLYDTRDAEVDVDSLTGEITGGYFVNLMREAARRGDFELLEDVAPDIPAVFGNWTEYMHWGVDHYDIFSDWWAVTAETLDQDIVFPFGFLDMSKILVVQMPDSGLSFVDLAFSFLAPFHWSLWITLVAACFFAGIVFLLLERGHNEFDMDLEQASFIQAMIHSVWLSCVMLTGAGAFCPRTIQGKVFTFFWSFLVLLLVAAYTANLASYMVVKNTPTSEIQSLDDARRLGIRLCIPDLYDEVFERLRRDHPSLRTKAVTLEWGTDYFQSIRDGVCDAVLMTIFEWEAMKSQSLYHKDCDMLYPGRPFWTTGGGFPIRRDTSVHCTSFLNEVLGAIMAQMDNEGYMSQEFETYLERKQDVTCDDSGGEEERALSVSNMMGGFGIFALVSLLIVLWTFIADRRGLRVAPTAPTTASVSTTTPTPRLGKPSAVATGPRTMPPNSRSFSQRVLLGSLPESATGSGAPATIPSSNRVWDSGVGAEGDGKWVDSKKDESHVTSLPSHVTSSASHVGVKEQGHVAVKAEAEGGAASVSVAQALEAHRHTIEAVSPPTCLPLSYAMSGTDIS